MRIGLILLFFIGLSSCSFFQNDEKIHLASIHGNDLFFDDIEYSLYNFEFHFVACFFK